MRVFLYTTFQYTGFLFVVISLLYITNGLIQYGVELSQNNKLASVFSSINDQYTVIRRSPINFKVSTSTVSVLKIHRLANPYSSSPLSSENIISLSRAALINIICTRPDGIPISGSGVIVDPRGIVLTNAHVAQYVFLAENGITSISCIAKSGSPSRDAWNIDVIYMPNSWTIAHTNEINTQHPMGTGEHDYALLQLSPLTAGASKTIYPFVGIDTRENIAFLHDRVIASGYPAEIFTPEQVTKGLYAISTMSTIQKLFTFNGSNIDAFSIGNTPLAQTGSSGGMIVNQWGKLVGIISTTSSGPITTRNVDAISLNYIDSDIASSTSKHLLSLIDNASQETHLFNMLFGPSIIEQYRKALAQ